MKFRGLFCYIVYGALTRTANWREIQKEPEGDWMVFVCALDVIHEARQVNPNFCEPCHANLYNYMLKTKRAG